MAAHARIASKIKLRLLPSEDCGGATKSIRPSSATITKIYNSTGLLTVPSPNFLGADIINGGQLTAQANPATAIVPIKNPNFFIWSLS